MVQGILKRYSRLASPRPLPTNEDSNHNVQDESPKRKRVSFDGAEPAKVFEADEWDRSPAAVTLKLTFKDVAELRELNVSIVRPSPLAMVRTASRRPTKKRTPAAMSPPSNDSNSPSSADASPLGQPHVLAAAPASISSSYQYHTFTSQSLGSLTEDVSIPPPPPSRAEQSGSMGSLIPDPSLSPPGLPTIRSPLFKGANAPVVPSPPLSRSSSSKLTPRSTPSIPLYRHPRIRNKGAGLVGQGTTEAPVSVVLPKLSYQASVAQDLKFDKLALDSEDEEDENPSQSHKVSGLNDMDVNTHPSVLASGKDMEELERPSTPVVSRKSGKSLMGWEFKRNPLGFGLILTRPKPGIEESV